MIYNL